MREGKKGREDGEAGERQRSCGRGESEAEEGWDRGEEGGDGRGNTLAIPKWQFRNFSLGQKRCLRLYIDKNGADDRIGDARSEGRGRR